ncbi:CPCC family cysteine-rich protein [Flavobacterium sharifuzzamanii]|uniref:CPCC family cysteine-rich protein n=1 Tax=Flavobacterium sharifuzzamanii TaxID=2211133 RepID=UPI000DAF35D2|nr:CPCC family cysteine-rich protein [Flavobacterium sharifuzzamanii]KAF2078770.1 hypothetical protein DMA14_19985 [Flavobacterium sharifuzzamanii]
MDADDADFGGFYKVELMNREEAKKVIAVYEMQNLSSDEKLEILECNYWFFGDKEGITEAIEEGSYPEISEDLIEIIDKTPDPFLNAESEGLVVDYLVNGLKYVTNLYLQTKLKSINPNFKDKIFGEVERAGLCPCCEYYSIDYGEDGLWDICPVCFWENGGEGPNHMTLEQAKFNFEKFGAINKDSLGFVDKNGAKKYCRKE